MPISARPISNSNRQSAVLPKVLLFALSLIPAAFLIFRGLTNDLGPNPAEEIQLTTGIWALRFLLITLAITPIRRLTSWHPIIRYRRMLGLFAFFYATVHLASYVVFDVFFALNQVIADVAKRPFITLGMLAFVLMVPLALTSTKGWIRRLGRRWQMLHRLVYVAGIAACLHFIWKVKVAIGEPVYYAIVLAALLGFRIVWRLRSGRALHRQ